MTKLDLLIFKESLFVFSQVSTCANSVFMIFFKANKAFVAEKQQIEQKEILKQATFKNFDGNFLIFQQL